MSVKCKSVTLLPGGSGSVRGVAAADRAQNRQPNADTLKEPMISLRVQFFIVFLSFSFVELRSSVAAAFQKERVYYPFSRNRLAVLSNGRPSACRLSASH